MFVFKLLLKIIFLGLVDAISVPILIDSFKSNFGVAIVLLIGAIGLNIALLSKKAYPLRYLLPGMFIFGLMVVYPIVYNINVAFMRYGTGNLLSKEQVIKQLMSKYYQPENSESFRYFIFPFPDGWKILFLNKEGKVYITQGDRVEELKNIKDVVFDDSKGSIIEYKGVKSLKLPDIVKNLSKIQNMKFKLENGEILKFYSVREFRVMLPLYSYNSEKDILIDNKTGKVYKPIRGFFRSDDGEKLTPGFRDYVGFENFKSIFTNPQISKPFFKVFGWNFLWAFLSVLLTFSLGLSLAIALNDSTLKYRYFYRTLLIIPYAIPSYISVLIWKGLFNTNFGVINNILQAIVGIRIDWLHQPFWAKVALLVVNLWLGFPYMMLISLGALQSIPKELYEAARVDGANEWQRFWKITMPLLMISLTPLLIGSFAFNFNNFNVIYLLTGGGPPIPGSETPAGATDILISYTYKLAFGTSGAQYGYAAAISVIIFMIVATISSISFRLTKKFEEYGKSM